MVDTMIDSTPATGVRCTGTSGAATSRWLATEHPARTAPVSRDTGTAVPFAALVQVALGARVTDLPGLPPRGAPV